MATMKHKKEYPDWIREFYPISASECVQRNLDNDVALVDHCIQKWTGVLPENLGQYAVVERVECELHFEDGETFSFGGDTCALCQKYVLPTGSCIGCPLYAAQGGIKCSDYTSPYYRFLSEKNNDGSEMLAALYNARIFASNAAAGKKAVPKNTPREAFSKDADRKDLDEVHSLIRQARTDLEDAYSLLNQVRDRLDKEGTSSS